ncbi:hypothetical protein ABKV19_026828, partial [Rosa sericea]
MIAEKPSWIRHEGLQIFSIDVQPGGLRVATGGGDHKPNFIDWECLAPVGWTNGTSKIAIGSQDHTITVWTTASPCPLFVAKRFFTHLKCCGFIL